MADLLIKVYDLPRLPPMPDGCTVRRAMAYETTHIVRWVRERFGDGWADECTVALSRTPATCYIATRAASIQGFACFDSTALGMFGPIGVDAAARGQRLGSALLLACLAAMRERGYAYAVVGGAGSTDFYRNVVEVVEIPGSVPGLYRDRLRT